MVRGLRHRRWGQERSGRDEGDEDRPDHARERNLGHPPQVTDNVGYPFFTLSDRRGGIEQAFGAGTLRDMFTTT
ncbi:hypothetical protein GCM10009795_039820 [Nocardioides hankookensis]